MSNRRSSREGDWASRLERTSEILKINELGASLFKIPSPRNMYNQLTLAEAFGSCCVPGALQSAVLIFRKVHFHVFVWQRCVSFPL